MSLLAFLSSSVGIQKAGCAAVFPLRHTPQKIPSAAAVQPEGPHQLLQQIGLGGELLTGGGALLAGGGVGLDHSGDLDRKSVV